MTATLRVIIDPMIAPVPGGIGRYTEELTRALIDTAPAGCDVVAVVSAVPADTAEHLRTLLPGIADLIQMPLNRRLTGLAWRHGLTSLPGTPLRDPGMIHAPSLLAPLQKRDRRGAAGNQTAVTIHDVLPWTHPHTLPPGHATWRRAMAARAWRYADAVVVPSHAVAEELRTRFDFGDRIRVIGGAVSPKLVLPVDPDARAERLGLPEHYILCPGTIDPRKGVTALIEALAHPDSPGLPLVIAGPHSWRDYDLAKVAADAGLDPARIHNLGFVADADLAVTIDRADVVVLPSQAEGFGLPVIEAFSLGTPVVHSDSPAIMEISAGAGLAVEHGTGDAYAGRLAAAIRSVVEDTDLATRLRYSGLDRAQAFSWQGSAEKVWQLHADL